MVERARRLRENLEKQHTFPLYLGIEGKPVTERVLAELFKELGVVDLRTLAPLGDVNPDLQAEEVFQAVRPDGVTLRLMRVPSDDGSKLVELEADRPNTAEHVNTVK